MKVNVRLAVQAKSANGTVWAVIRNPATGEYLLGLRGPSTNNANQWGFPGGGIDDGESFETALLREVEEEIQVTLSEKELHIVIQDEPTMSTWFEVFSKVKPAKTQEVVKFKWVHPHDMDSLPLHKSVRGYFAALHKATST